MSITLYEEEFEDTKREIRIRISKKEQATQWPKEKVQKDKQRSTKHTYKTKDRVALVLPVLCDLHTITDSHSPTFLYLIASAFQYLQDIFVLYFYDYLSNTPICRDVSNVL